MPPTYTDEGLRIAALVRRQHRDVGVLVLSQYVIASYATNLLDIVPTHCGYLLKERVLSASILDDGLTRVAAGETVIDPDIVRILMRPLPPTGPVSMLSTGERDILALLAEGLSDRGIASKLCISQNTVGTHIQRIFTKLKLPDSSHDNRRVHAVLTWLESQPHDDLRLGHP
jgi:DNA-binding NarL/FixJ family response regulator